MAIGGSQGGHAAISANELGEQHAPELDLLGTVALAPGAMFDRRYGGVDALVARVVSAMALYGAATEHPEIDPDDYVTPAAAAASSAIQTGCLNEITAAFLAVPFDGFYAHDPLVTEPARSLATANDVGRFRVDVPLFVVQGTADTTVLPQRTRDLFDRLCNTGQVTNYLEVVGAGHNDVLTRSLTQVQGWFADRLANRPATTSCAPWPGVPTVVPGVGSVPEGDAGTAQLDVPLSLSAASNDTVTVQWRTIEPDIPLPASGARHRLRGRKRDRDVRAGPNAGPRAHRRPRGRGHGVRRAHRRVLRQPDPRAHGRLLGTGLRIARRRRLIPLVVPVPATVPSATVSSA